VRFMRQRLILKFRMMVRRRMSAMPTARSLQELAPAGNGVRLRLAVRPLGEEGPRSLPGRGGARLLADVHGERRAARRDLKTERAVASPAT
jgi:hypothetical protein